MKSISILGCGWLGEPLALDFIKKNIPTLGSTTSLEKKDRLEAIGIKTYQISLNPDFQGDANFLNSETLIVNIPPKAKAMGEDFHLRQIGNLLSICEKAKNLKNIIFISSTSVYPNLENTMIESDADTSHFLYKAENLIIDFCKRTNRLYLILRFGGLMGYDRNPCKYFSDSTCNDHSRVNYLHRDDAIGALIALLEGNIWNDTFNVASPLHPTRAEIWNRCSQKLNSVSKNQKVASKKTISSEKFLRISKYQFQFPDPLAFKYL